MTLTTVFLGYAFERDFDVVSATRPGWLTAFSTCSSAAHSFPSLYSLVFLNAGEFFQVRYPPSRLTASYPNLRNSVVATCPRWPT